ncbi:hypothetical protein CASFOL_009578 [Castilleja foliolosa]|uniref:Uncharacterized protein n=1 Tax=Castilleja foliolosa TaxID=1961234 RepID=A0ABD3DWI0_9LAMI
MDMTATDGPILNKRVSPLDGRRFSFQSSFVPSARACRIPKGPAYSGPIRCCIPADISLSNQTITKTPSVIPNTSVKIGPSITDLLSAPMQLPGRGLPKIFNSFGML